MSSQKTTEQWKVKEVRLWAMNDEGLYKERVEIAKQILKKELKIREASRLAKAQAEGVIAMLKGSGNEEFNYTAYSTLDKATAEIMRLIREEIKIQREIEVEQ